MEGKVGEDMTVDCNIVNLLEDDQKHTASNTSTSLPIIELSDDVKCNHVTNELTY